MSDENEELQSWIEPDLEARVVAWVLGEASEFEGAELERIIAEKPELEIFKRRMEAVHGLVGAACKMELDPMRMEAGRRERLLERLGKTEGVAPAGVVAMPEPVAKRRISWGKAVGIAACFLIAVVLVLSISGHASYKGSAKQQIEEEKLDELATAGHAGPDMPPTGSMAPPVSVPMSFKAAAPAQTERLAALDSLKALANKRKDEDEMDDSGAGAGGQSADRLASSDVSKSPDASSVNADELVTKVYRVPAGFLPAVPVTNGAALPAGGADADASGGSASLAQPHQSAMDALAKQGVKFPPGANAVYLPQSNRLIVHNTESNIGIVDAITEDSAPPIAATANAPARAETDAQTADLAQLRFERSQLHREYDYRPSDAPGELQDKARAMFAAGGYATAQRQAQAAEQQLDNSKSAQAQAAGTENLARNIINNSSNLTADADANATVPPEGGEAKAALAQANTYTGAATVSGGNLAIPAAAAASAALANSGPPVPTTAPQAAEAPAAAPQVAMQGAAATAMPAQAPMAEMGGVALQAHVAEPRQVQLGDIPVLGRVAGQAQDEGAKAGAKLLPPTGQAEHAAPASVAEKKDFGVAGGAARDVAAMAGKPFIAYGQPIEGKLTQGATSQTFAFNGPTQVDADPAKRRILAQPEPPTIDEVSATDQPYSTFSLHVSDVSFLLAKASLAAGQLPERDSIRPEEFYNAFDYGDPAPATGEKIACRIEQAAHPMLQQRNLVRIAMKVAATGRGQGQPLRLTVLLDTSGSMEREDRAASVQKAMQVLTSLLGPKDAVTLIGFARQPRLLAEAVPGDQAGKLAETVKHTPAEGGTNMEEALKTASELALRHYDANGQNRVVMLTDGAANLGDADPEQLARLVERLRQQGVSFDACGVGADGLNDDILEALTRKGGGRYYFLNRPEDADEGFARQLAGAFRPAAENVKMQVRFNPDRVGKYRLIGFEKHRLAQEDFRNDKVTAAQLAAEEAAVALYQVQVLPEGEGEIGEVFVRFRDPADGRMVEQSWTIPYDAQASALDKASGSMQLAATASLLAEKLRGGPAGDAVDLDALAPIVGKLRGEFAQQARVGDLVGMFEEARRMTK